MDMNSLRGPNVEAESYFKAKDRQWLRVTVEEQVDVFRDQNKFTCIKATKTVYTTDRKYFKNQLISAKRIEMNKEIIDVVKDTYDEEMTYKKLCENEVHNTSHRTHIPCVSVMTQI